MISGIISWLFFGFIAGALARFLMPGSQPMGCFMTIGLGIFGSFVGGAISYMIWGLPGENWVQPSGWIMSILGAIIVLAVSGWAANKQGE